MAEIETITQLLIDVSAYTLKNASKNEALPKANHTIHQEIIGDKCKLQKWEWVVILFVLATDHNIIDFILNDYRSGSEVIVYRIHISAPNYSRKKKKKSVIR